MRKTLVLTREDLEDPCDFLDEYLIWEDESDSGRWEEYHTGVIEYNGNYWLIDWVTGLTEEQEDQWFEYAVAADGSMTLPEAESYEITEKRWRVKQ